MAVGFSRGNAGFKRDGKIQVLPMGGGGFVTNICVAGDGTVVCTTDVYGGYVRSKDDHEWRQLATLASLPGIPYGQETNAMWEARVAYSDSRVIYFTHGAPPPNAAYPRYAVYRSADQGITAQATDLRLSHAEGSGEHNSRFMHGKMVIDPTNPNVVYVGGAYGETVSPGWWRTTNGINFTQVSGLPTPDATPGCAGATIDESLGLTTLGGVSVCKRVMLGVGGYGYYESHDGGNTFARASSDPVTTGNMSITTTGSNRVIVLMVTNQGGHVRNINNVAYPGSAPTWTKRSGVNGLYGWYNIEEFWCVAPTAGTYTFNVEMPDGLSGYHIAGTNTCCGAAAFKGSIDVTSASTIFDGGGPAGGQGDGGTYPNLTTTATQSLVFCFGGVYSGRTSVDTGYSLLANDVTHGFWSEVANAMQGPGATGTLGISGIPFIIDAIKQTGGTAITVDGTPVTAYAAPAAGLQPTIPQAAQVDYSGTLWCADGITGTYNSGGFHRYVIGASAGAGTWSSTVSPATTTAGALGSTPLVDKRSGHQGDVIILGPGGKNTAMQTNNGTAAQASITWRGGYGFPVNTTITSSDAPWLANSGAGGGGSFGDAAWDYSFTPPRLWMAHGLGVLYCDPSPDFGIGTYSVGFNHLSGGIDEFITSDFCTPLGHNYPPLVGVEDRIVMFTNPYSNPPGYIIDQWPYADTCNWQMDWAKADPNYVVAFNTGLNGPFSGFSMDYGKPGTWNLFYTLPPDGVYANVNVSNGAICTTSGKQVVQARFDATITTTTSTSTSSMTIGTGSHTATIEAGKGAWFVPGFWICFTSIENVYFSGTITSYDNSTGVVVFNCPDTSHMTDPAYVGLARSYWTVKLSKDNYTVYGVLQASNISGTMAAGQLVKGAGIDHSVYLDVQGGGAYTNSWMLQFNGYGSGARVSSSTPMHTLSFTGKIAVIIGLGVKPVYYSDDGGKTWGTSDAPSASYNPVDIQNVFRSMTGDYVLKDVMYLDSPGNGQYKSTNGGKNWTRTNTWTLTTAYCHQNQTIPGKEGHIWACLLGYGNNGLYYTETGGLGYDGGSTTHWNLVPDISHCQWLAVGATRPGASYPTILIQAHKTSTNEDGLFYSTDKGVTWTKIDSTAPTKKSLSGITFGYGDLNIPGRFYVAYWAVGCGWIQLWSSNATLPTPTIALDPAYDLGTITNDNITSSTTPGLVLGFPSPPDGSAALVTGDTITLQVDGLTYANHTVTSGEAAGTSSVAFGGMTALTNGVHSLRIMRASGGATSDYSIALILTITASPP